MLTQQSISLQYHKHIRHGTPAAHGRKHFITTVHYIPPFRKYKHHSFAEITFQVYGACHILPKNGQIFDMQGLSELSSVTTFMHTINI